MRSDKNGYRNNAKLGQAATTTQQGEPAVWRSQVTAGTPTTQYVVETSLCKLRRQHGEKCSW